jgi:hypothetical protein
MTNTSILDTIQRHQDLFKGKSSAGDAHLWVYCNEDSFWYKHCEDSKTDALIAYEQEDSYFNNWYITFCPQFFDPNFEVSLDDVLKKVREENRPPGTFDVYEQPTSQALTFFHETM